MRSTLLVILACALASCGGDTRCDAFRYTQTGPVRDARNPACDLQVYLTIPMVPYTELGSSDWTDCDPEVRAPVSPDELLSAVGEQACAAGGNAIIAMRGAGDYEQAIVIDVPSLCMMPVDHLPASEVPRCADETRTCLLGCSTYDCQDACFAADPTPPAADGRNCRGCVIHTGNYCTGIACPTEWAAYDCCFEARCAGTTDLSCSDTMCGTELAAVRACTGAATGGEAACFDLGTGEPHVCFP